MDYNNFTANKNYAIWVLLEFRIKAFNVGLINPNSLTLLNDVYGKSNQ